MHNLEIESKYKIEDLKKIESIILALGAKFQKQSNGIDTYFLIPENPEGRKYLRIREHDRKAEISYCYAQSDTHTEEYETGINDPEIGKEILKNLGFDLDVVVDKVRKIYTYKKSEIVLDEVKDLGSFMEIESPNIKELEEIAKEVGLTEKERVKGMGYPDLIRTK